MEQDYFMKVYMNKIHRVKWQVNLNQNRKMVFRKWSIELKLSGIDN